MLRIVVPARLGSTRLPDKMIQRIGSKMLIEHSIARVIEASHGLFEVYLATDSDIIAGAAFGRCTVVMTSDCRSGTDRCAEVAEALKWDDDSIVVNVQADMPFVKPADLRGFFLTAMADGAEWDVLTGRCRQAHVKADRGTFCRATTASHVGIYAYRCQALKRFAALPTAVAETVERLEQLRASENGFRFAFHDFPEMPLEINTPDDLDMVRRIAACLA